MRHVFNKGMLVGVVAVVASLIVNAGLAYRNIRQLDEDAAWVAHTHEVLDLTSDIQLTLIHAKAGQADFLVTGEDESLQLYNPAFAHLSEKLAELKDKTRDNPRQQNRIGALQRMIAEYQARLQDGIDRRRKGLDEDQIIMSLKKGNHQMNALQDLIADMERDEHTLLEDRELTSHEAYGFAVTTGVLATALALIMTVALVCLVQRNILARQRAERTIRSVNAALEDRVEIRTEELRRTTEELARSNLDLAQFAYVASHDLQEPLRAVAGCVEMLKSRYQGQLDNRADELISHTVDGANRMRALIEDLLSYSRMGIQSNAFEPSDCNKILSRAIANLHAVMAEAGAVVTHDPLPIAKVDAVQLTQLFQNLVSNAIKFRGPQPPRIHIAVHRDEGHWAFSVKDNGIGIKPEFFKRIFVIFQRLHTRTEYSGTGIGLAICQKIAERHGGRIFVESEPGQGSTFFFTIPADALPIEDSPTDVVNLPRHDRREVLAGFKSDEKRQRADFPQSTPARGN